MADQIQTAGSALLHSIRFPFIACIAVFVVILVLTAVFVRRRLNQLKIENENNDAIIDVDQIDDTIVEQKIDC